jgi:hypothetical protein
MVHFLLLGSAGGDEIVSTWKRGMCGEKAANPLNFGILDQ